jgi:hypothetical protein
MSFPIAAAGLAFIMVNVHNTLIIHRSFFFFDIKMQETARAPPPARGSVTGLPEALSQFISQFIIPARGNVPADK